MPPRNSIPARNAAQAIARLYLPGTSRKQVNQIAGMIDQAYASYRQTVDSLFAPLTAQPSLDRDADDGEKVGES